MGSFRGVIKWESILKMGVIRWEQNVKNKKGVIQWQVVWKWVNVAAHTRHVFLGSAPPRHSRDVISLSR